MKDQNFDKKKNSVEQGGKKKKIKTYNIRLVKWALESSR